jgi:carbon-monoxide dehydrogenase large subunit
MTDLLFGQSIPRREDERLITGQGRYTDDIVQDGALHIAFVRSPHPAARLVSIDAGDALTAPGVQAVFTAQDLAADGIRDFSLPVKVARVSGGVDAETPRSLLVRDRVRFLGEPVAMVLAQTAAAAVDAAEQVLVDYEEMNAVVTREDAASPGAALVWEDRPGNLAYQWRRGDTEAIAAALASSHHVTELNTRITRVSANPLEPRSAFAYLDEAGRTVLRVSHQSPHLLRNALCTMFGLERKDIRVMAGDVGGSFGMKSGLLREETLCFWAARHLGRAVRWTATRGESFLSDEQGRDVAIVAKLGLDAQGNFTALQVRLEVNIGSHLSARSTSQIGNFGGIAGVYRTPAILGEAVGYFTNTHPIAAYRGAGRPEATYVIERIIDVAAGEMGMDPVDLRRRNLIPPEAMPYQTPFVFRYDCGEFERNMDRALELSNYAGFPKRRAESLSRGRLRGIGMSNPIEVAAGPFAKPATDYAAVRAHPDGTATLYSGAMSVGQGLETALTTIVSQALSIPLEKVRYVQGDTDALANGKGNGGSAALTLCGPAIQLGIEELVEKGMRLAADELEVSRLDLEFSDGEFRIVGSDRSIGLAEIARIAETTRGEEGVDGLAGSGEFAMEQPTYPNGCHICEVEIDPETGLVEPANYVSVEDVGRVLNPMLVDGQIQGGVAQGMGQALLEEIRYDGEGQIQTGSFMDYAMPRATDLPSITSATLETPTMLNSLGVKGVGEAGAVGALAATMNAICNALEPLGIKNLDMPATPVRVWQAIVDAKAAQH